MILIYSRYLRSTALSQLVLLFCLTTSESFGSEDQVNEQIKVFSQSALALGAQLHERAGEPEIAKRLSDYFGGEGPKTQGDNEFIHSIGLLGTRGWAVDWNGALHMTQDGGVHWSEVSLPLGEAHRKFVTERDPSALNPFPCRSSSFADSKFGLATCGSKVLSTRDGGSTWKIIRQFPKLDQHVIASCAASNCWVGGNIQGVQHLRVRDAKWIAQDLPQQDAPLQCLQFLTPDIGKAITAKGTVYETKDGGTTWISISQGTPRPPNGCFYLSQNVGWTVGDMGSISKTTDGGRTWVDKITVDALEGVPMDQANLKAIYFADANSGWAVGWQGLILATTDGGENWNRQHLWELGRQWEPGQYWLSLYSLYAKDRKTAWIAGNSGNIFATVDGGGVWIPVHGPAFKFLRAIPSILNGTGRD